MRVMGLEGVAGGGGILSWPLTKYAGLEPAAAESWRRSLSY